MTKLIKHLILLAVSMMLLPAAAVTNITTSADAIARLLNSRSAGVPRTYLEAAEIVAADAKRGAPLQRFVLALISNDRYAPECAKLDDETRKLYLDSAREKILTMAERTDNSLAWYLIAVEKGDTNLLHRAAKLGNVQALNAWGSHLISQAEHSYDPVARHTYLTEAFKSFKAAAKQHDYNGIYNLGMCFSRGLGVEKDPNNAFTCFCSAAKRGHAEAINTIGGFFREGLLVKKDLKKANKWFKKSCDFNNRYGQLNYGLALLRGEGVAEDTAEAVRLFTLSAEQGCAEAALCLSSCYDRGVGVEKDVLKALKWKMHARAMNGDEAARDWLKLNGERIK